MRGVLKGCGCVLAAVGTMLALAGPAGAAGNIVVSQVYGGGGNTGAPYRSDFVELFNRSTSTISITGWSVQYSSATGTGNFGSNPVTTLHGVLIPGQYFLVESGLHYNWHRHYDPTIGRYTQPDPWALEAGPNLYAYALNNPNAMTDPTGENPILLLCMRAPRVCREILECIRNPALCKGKFCRAGQTLYKPLCSVPACRPGDGQATLEFKLAAAEACFLLRVSVARFCHNGIDDPHGPPLDEAMRKVEQCRQQCIASGKL